MKRILFIGLLLQSICFNTIAQTNSEELFSLASLFDECDLIIPVDDERYFSAPEGTYSRVQVMNIPASNQADLLHKVLIIVDSTLYSELSFEINRYAYDIHHVYGCNVIMERVVSETCQDVKNLILSHQNNLDGCVFIGDISYLQSNPDSTLCWYFGLTIIGDPLVNFFHCTNSTCQSLITLNSYDSTSSPLSYYLASDKITVAPSANYTIPLGDHCILNAPTVEIHGEFLCPRGSTMEVLNEGCKENCDE